MYKAVAAPARISSEEANSQRYGPRKIWNFKVKGRSSDELATKSRDVKLRWELSQATKSKGRVHTTDRKSVV